MKIEKTVVEKVVLEEGYSLKLTKEELQILGALCDTVDWSSIKDETAKDFVQTFAKNAADVLEKMHVYWDLHFVGAKPNYLFAGKDDFDG